MSDEMEREFEKAIDSEGMVDPTNLAEYARLWFYAGYTAARRWIPVSERLPGERDSEKTGPSGTYTVVCKVQSGGSFVYFGAEYYSDYKDDYTDYEYKAHWDIDGGPTEPYEVTHYQPAPESPEKTKRSMKA